MESETKELLAIEPLLCRHAEIGRCLWGMQDIRNRTLEILQDLTQQQLDWRPSENDSSIGSLLYHIALIETDWLYVEVLEQARFLEHVANWPLMRLSEQPLSIVLPQLTVDGEPAGDARQAR